MRSKASIKGHPIHPALIPFPFAFLIGSFFFDVAGVFLNKDTLLITAEHLALSGVIMGLVAAVPGVIDYLRTVPPDSTAKIRATKHGLANVSAVGLFAVVWTLKHSIFPPDYLVLPLEGIAVGFLIAGGWMGGTLVNRNQIGVDHRYANAGKWREVTVEAHRGKPVAVARADELEVNQLMLLHVNDQRIVLARTEEGYVAFQDSCTHRGASLADGAFACGTVQCPWHGSQFDARTGKVRAGPAEKPLNTYRVDESGGEVLLLL
jgi:nitrite reductase/ring-hydroxylating ferredoxin subunit/uncharacterized membrane protein